MPERGLRWRAIGLTIGALVAAVVLGLGALTWLVRSSGPSVRVVSEEGGVSVEVPRNWSVEKVHPTDPDHQEYLNGRERAVLGLLQRGGFWVARWPAASDATTATIKQRMRADQDKRRRDGWSIADGRLAGRDAVVLRYAEPPKALERLGLGDVRVIVREVLAGGFVFQVGTWSLPHSGNLAERLERIAQSVEIFEPQPWTVALADPDVQLRLPGGWVEHETAVPGAVFFAVSPGDPNDAWVYIFRYRDSPTASLRSALRNIPKHGGAITGQRDEVLRGRKAVRLEFTFKDGDDRPPARGIEWFISDDARGTLVFAVGRRVDDASIADRLVQAWRF